MTRYRYPRARILVFAKAPVPGQCKTRLIPELGAKGAARVQRALLDKTLRTALASDLAPVELWCAPSARHAVFRQAGETHGVRLRTQPRGDLGARMDYALRQTLCLAGPGLLIGTDCPVFAPRHLAHALAALNDGADVVVCPAEDGGYVLIGARKAISALFRGMPWGGAAVMAATRRELGRLGIRHTELPPLWDVDEPADLRRAYSQGLLQDKAGFTGLLSAQTIGP
jgi:rSAM/selenodomain-associated transferase 1